MRRLDTAAMLIVVNAAVWAAVWIAGIWCTPERWLSLPADTVIWLTRPWTLLTYMVVHYSFWHLLMNMLWLWMFGRVITLTMPGSAIFRLYLAGGLTGGAAYLALGAATGYGGMLCGASAAVLAIMVAAGMRSPDMELHLFLLGNIRLKWVVLAGIILLMAGAGGGSGLPSVAAHAGGLLAGLIYMLRLRRLSRRNARGFPRKNTRRVRQIIRRHHADTMRLNALLEKISSSSYDSLSTAEKRELHRLSQRLGASTSSLSDISDK